MSQPAATSSTREWGRKPDYQELRAVARVRDAAPSSRATRPAIVRNARTTGEVSSRRQASAVCTAGERSTSGRYSTPRSRMLRADAGTSATPMPADTRPTTAWVWLASCATRGAKPCCRQKPSHEIVQHQPRRPLEHHEGHAGQPTRDTRDRRRQRMTGRQRHHQRFAQQRRSPRALHPSPEAARSRRRCRRCPARRTAAAASVRAGRAGPRETGREIRAARPAAP